MRQSKKSPGPQRSEITPVLEILSKHASSYLESLDNEPVRHPEADKAASRFDGPLPEVGAGAVSALETLIREGTEAALNSSGPRFFHFVMGGSTPAALGADWLTSVLDQVAYAWVSSPLALKLEMNSLDWLRKLFDLPGEWGGIMTTGATMANFTGLAAARQWWGEKQGFDIAENGLSQLPSIPVFSSGYVHASTIKALGMLGIGRSSLKIFSCDARGRLDVTALKRALKELAGSPAILIGNAGEVNAGDFDPIEKLADLAEQYEAWLHVDGAFGLFARISPQTKHLTKGVERADSITVDGHKWLNVPYDTGFSFVRDRSILGRTFAYSADYLPNPSDPRPNMGTLGPESSRRARSLAVWTTLKAYGQLGYRNMVKRHLTLAQYLAKLIDDAPELERLAEVPLNIVCFRYNPGEQSEAELNRLNEQLGETLLNDGRVYAGTTIFEGRTALRPAIVNWRTREKDINIFINVVLELAQNLDRDSS